MTAFFGQFHPAFVHFPIALLLTAMAAEAVAWATGRNWIHHVGVFNLHLGGISAILAAALGCALAATTDVETALRGTLLYHRWTGIAAALWSLVALLAWHGRRLGGRPGSLAWYRLALLAGGGLIAVCAFLGGAMLYGWDHYQWPR